MKKVLLGAILALLLFTGCPSNAVSPPKILFPQDGAVYREGDSISLVADGPVEWSLEDGTVLGEGVSISAILDPGDYTVYGLRDAVLDYISLTVVEDRLSSGETEFFAARSVWSPLPLPAGSYSGVVFSTESASRSFFLNQDDSSVNSRWIGDSDESFPVPRSLRLEYSPGLSVGEVPSVSRTLSVPVVGNHRSFRIANPALGTQAPGFTIDAELLFLNTEMEIWVDVETPVESALRDELIGKISTTAFPRTQALWGEARDRDGNGRTILLLSGKLNDAGGIVGFFNPSDYYAYDGDVLSSTYNPTSNEADMLYLCLPEVDTVAFSPGAIAATAAHEYQHLVRFSQKTWFPEVSGSASPIEDTCALDEGFAHLTESLVGLGCSGGNQLFVEHYLKNPQNYPIRDLDGSGDSSGKRGGAALFFAWLLEKAGGIEWQTASPHLLTTASSGGRAFLQATLNYRSDGWTAIGNYFEETPEALFREYVTDLQQQSLDPSLRPAVRLDQATGEPVYLHPFLGVFPWNGEDYVLDGPVKIPFTLDISMPISSWSFSLYESFYVSSSENYGFFCEEAEGGLFLGLTIDYVD